MKTTVFAIYALAFSSQIYKAHAEDVCRSLSEVQQILESGEEVIEKDQLVFKLSSPVAQIVTVLAGIASSGVAYKDFRNAEAMIKYHASIVPHPARIHISEQAQVEDAQKLLNSNLESMDLKKIYERVAYGEERVEILKIFRPGEPTPIIMKSGEKLTPFAVNGLIRRHYLGLVEGIPQTYEEFLSQPEMIEKAKKRYVELLQDDLLALKGEHARLGAIIDQSVPRYKKLLTQADEAINGASRQALKTTLWSPKALIALGLVGVFGTQVYFYLHSTERKTITAEEKAILEEEVQRLSENCSSH